MFGKDIENNMKKELTLDELRSYRLFIINYTTRSKMVKELIHLFAYNYWITRDYGEWLNSVSLFCDKTLNGKCSWQRYKHPTQATKKFLRAVLDYQDEVLK